MKNSFLILLVLLPIISANAQGFKKLEFQDVCGDPTMESMAWQGISGRVSEVIDGETIVLNTSKGRKTVDLVTIDSSTNQSEAKEFLVKKVLKEKVTVWVTPGKLDNLRFFGLVWLGEKAVNRMLIEKGISRFKEPEPYSISNYASCVFQQLEEKAKDEKLGIWSEQ